MMWFERLTGFAEESPEQVRAHLSVNRNELTSHVNEKVFVCGELETPSLAELRTRVDASDDRRGRISLSEIVANVQELHMDQANARALFQVASQFNLLEMISPHVTPECGVGIYQNDPTQGPACAIAAGAGTIYRNYFVNVDGETGQLATRQIDCLRDIGNALGNSDHRLWEMKNGYALATSDGLLKISQRLQAASEKELDELRQLLRIGVHWNTQVTISDCHQLVSQAYCSALPVRYSRHNTSLWAPFAKLVLEASYEATICVAILNSIRNGSSQLFLTLLGGGAFGNVTEWIVDAIERAIQHYPFANLNVAIVSYGGPNPHVRSLVDRLNG